jgi:hypothetical protein
LVILTSDWIVPYIGGLDYLELWFSWLSDFHDFPIAVEEKKTTKGTTESTDRTKIVQVTRNKFMQVTRNKFMQVTRTKIMPPKITAARAWPWLKTTSGQGENKGKKAMEVKNSAGAQRSRWEIKQRWRRIGYSFGKKTKRNEFQLIYVVKVQDIQEGDRGPSRDGLKDGLIDLLVTVAGVVDQNSVSLDDAGEVWPKECDGAIWFC